jgi:hypothetical protein
VLPPVPPVPGPLLPPVLPPEPVPVMHWPFVHVPLHATPQPPQFVLLVSVSTHAPLHSICPATAQPQVPPLQAVAPVGQALQPPQCAIVLSPPLFTQAVPHIIWFEGQLAMHVLFAQTWPPGQALQPPQCVASDWTHEPPQSKRPAAHLHAPA